MRIDITVITSAMTEPRRNHCKTFLGSLSKHHDVTYRFVTDHDVVDSQFIRENVKLENNAVAHFDRHLRSLHIRNISNAQKHRAALRSISESELPCDALFIVLEDDAIPCANFVEDLASICSSLPAGYGIVSLGVPSPADAPQFRLLESTEVLPVCDSYIVSREAATAMSEAFYPVRYVTNVHLSYIAATTDISVHVASPSVFLDGSKFGGFISVLSPNSRLTLNGVFMDALRVITATSDPCELKEEISKIKECKYADHPDFMYLLAMATMKADGSAAAEPIFQTAMDVYDANSALLTNESTFLRDFINIYKDAQHV